MNAKQTTPMNTKQTMSEFVNQGFDIAHRLGIQSADLRKLARAATILGLTDLHEQLFSIAQSIEQEGENVRKMVGQRVNEDLKQAQEMSSNTLKSILIKTTA